MTSKASKQPVIVSWSGGKDAAFTLHTLARSVTHQPVALCSFVDPETGLAGRQHTSVDTLQAQALALDLPLFVIDMPTVTSNQDYVSRWKHGWNDMLHTMNLPNHQTPHMAFGDIHLADIKTWRDTQAASLGIQAIFPLFERHKTDPNDLLNDMLRTITAHIHWVDNTRLPKHFCGHAWDDRFIAQRPQHIDPFGEDGSFHTTVEPASLQPFRKFVIH